MAPRKPKDVVETEATDTDSDTVQSEIAHSAEQMADQQELTNIDANEDTVTDQENVPARPERMVSATGIPSARRGRSAKAVDYTNFEGINFEADIEELKQPEKWGEAYGYPEMKPKVATDLRKIYGVDARMRKVDPKNNNVGELWIQWPVYEKEDEPGVLYEDTEAIQENLEG